MLHRTSQLDGCRVVASDGEIGTIRDVYFDDQHWIVRYLIVDTGGWLSGRKVLISPHAIESVDADSHTVAVKLDRLKVERSPHIDTHKPVSRQREAEYYLYYGYPTYWSYPTNWVGGPIPTMGPIPMPSADRVELERRRRAMQSADGDGNDSHLRSIVEVTGYHIHATDHELGHVEDFLFDDGTWRICHLVVDTRNWLPGKHVLVSPQWIRKVDWPARAVKVDRSREAIKQGPEFDAEHLPQADFVQTAPAPRAQ